LLGVDLSIRVSFCYHVVIVESEVVMVDGKDVYIIGDKIDNKEIMIKSFLSSGYHVKGFSNSKDFYENKSDDFQGLYIIDWQLSDQPGIEIVSSIRKKDEVSPIFMLSDYTENADKIEGLRRGADDYITKPFYTNEVVLKGQNILKKISLLKSKFSGEVVKLLPEASSFIKDDIIISLTKREFIIFNHLFYQLDKPVSRESLIMQFSEEKMTDRNIDVHIFSLRKKIKIVDIVISTVWGTGYKLNF
jgi:DNA-binding response OmpR family regulator